MISYASYIQRSLNIQYVYTLLLFRDCVCQLGHITFQFIHDGLLFFAYYLWIVLLSLSLLIYLIRSVKYCFFFLLVQMLYGQPCRLYETVRASEILQNTKELLLHLKSSYFQMLRLGASCSGQVCRRMLLSTAAKNNILHWVLLR